jgi:hypothetical protein
MAEYSRFAKGHITTTASGGTPFINLPFQPQLVKWKNFTASTSGGATGYVTSGYWDVSMGQGAAIYELVTASTLALKAATTTTGGVYTFSGGISLQYGSLVLLGGSGGIAQTDSSTLSVTTTAAHGLKVGDWVVFQNLYETSTTGMQQIAGIPFIVKTVGSTTTFTVAWDGTAANLTAIDGSATGACGFKKILYPELYEPGVAFPWSITLSNGVVTVYTTAPTNFVVGQEIGFNIPSVYGAQELNELPDVLIPGSPQYYYVTAVGSVEVNSTYVDYFTFNYGGSLTTFNVAAPAFTSFPGLRFAQVKAVGDVNSGGYPYTGGNLYPSPTVVTGNTTTTLITSPTINGPAIQGAYINNTAQGFYIGATAAPTASQIIYWEAELVDYAVN